MARYKITYERDGKTVTATRVGETASAAAEKLCDQYGWGFKMKMYDADTRGAEWASCSAATDGGTNYDISMIIEKEN